jgi:hypothetical protein
MYDVDEHENTLAEWNKVRVEGKNHRKRTVVVESGPITPCLPEGGKFSIICCVLIL